ncbi:hypothetical protein V3C99_014949 [Haemonchus contortus]|uniref:Major sperm protein n=1 Tax=Haemonchus contortus TaxID=6289 RepID=A0A7I4YWF1_HAECO
MKNKVPTERSNSAEGKIISSAETLKKRQEGRKNEQARNEDDKRGRKGAKRKFIHVKMSKEAQEEMKKMEGASSERGWKSKIEAMQKKEGADDDVPAVVGIGDEGFLMTKNCFYWKKYGGTKQLTIHNNTDTIHAIKIKSSDNALYRITPPMGSVLPSETYTVKIHRTHAPIKPDKIIVISVPTVKEERYLEELFDSPFVPNSKLSITQIVEAGNNIPAYHAPCAPEGASCLKFSAVKLAFNGEVGGDQNLRITSAMAVRIGFKVQCTDNRLFLFRPVFGIIEPKETFRIKVTRSPHPRKRDKMIVCATVLKGEKESQLPSMFLKKGLSITELCIPLTCH